MGRRDYLSKRDRREAKQYTGLLGSAYRVMTKINRDKDFREKVESEIGDKKGEKLKEYAKEAYKISKKEV